MFQDKGSYKLKSFMKMNEHCPVCGQRMEIETGFYYGTGYVSYAITIAFSVSTLVAWWVLIGLSLNDNRVFWWMGTNAVLMLLLQPWLMRLSRAVWLSFFVKYNSNWESENQHVSEV
jgi:Na+-translocating ferredoxin:NAD+ oxidoreductase RnfA subunit